MENGQLIAFLQKQRDEDKDIEEKRHLEVLKQIKENRESVTQKINAQCLETEIKFKKHDKYHDENEHKWGVFKFIKDNTVKVVIVAFTLGTVLAGTVSLTYKDVLKGLINLAK